MMDETPLQCKICGVTCSDKIPWKQHHDHKLDDRLQNDQDKGGYHLCNTHRCVFMCKVGKVDVDRTFKPFL